jgi:hypothetical protein
MVSFELPISFKKAHLKCLYLYHNIYMRIKELKCSQLCHKSFKKPHLKCLYLYHNIYMGIQDLNTMVKKSNLIEDYLLAVVPQNNLSRNHV